MSPSFTSISGEILVTTLRVRAEKPAPGEYSRKQRKTPTDKVGMFFLTFWFLVFAAAFMRRVYPYFCTTIFSVTDQHAAFAAFSWRSFPPGLVAERILFKDQVAPFNV